MYRVVVAINEVGLEGRALCIGVVMLEDLIDNLVFKKRFTSALPLANHTIEADIIYNIAVCILQVVPTSWVQNAYQVVLQ